MAKPATPMNYGARRRGSQHASRIAEELNIENLFAVPVEEPAGDGAARADGGVEYIPISTIVADPQQPRKEFARAELQELADTILEHGVLQPILVSPIPTWNKSRPQVHTVIVGERRWRAAEIAGLERIPAIVRDVDNKTATELQLVENCTRVNLSEEEEAHAFRRLVEEFGYTIRQLARRLGKSHTDISRKMRIFNDPVLSLAVNRGDITISEAQELIVADNRAKIGLVSQMKERRASGTPATMQEVRQAVKTGNLTSNGASRTAREERNPYVAGNVDPLSLLRQSVKTLRVVADALESGRFNRAYERDMLAALGDAQEEMDRIQAVVQPSGRKAKSA